MFMRMYVVFLDFVHPALLQFFHFITFGAGNQMDSLQDMMDVLRNGVALFCHVLVIQIPDLIKIFTQAVFHHTVVDHCNPVDGAVIIQPKIRCSARKKHIGVRHILEIVHNAAADQAEFKFFTLLAKLQHIADAPAALIRGNESAADIAVFDQTHSIGESSTPPHNPWLRPDRNLGCR